MKIHWLDYLEKDQEYLTLEELLWTIILGFLVGLLIGYFGSEMIW